MRTKKLLALLTALCVLFLQFTSMPVTAATVGDLVVEGGAADADYRYNADRGVLEILSGTPLVIRNANPDAATSQRIFIRRDVAADITLAGVRIDNSGVSGVSAISAGAGSNASVTIRLQEGSVNTLKSGPYATPLQKEGGGDLIVSGSGTLIAEGGNEFASSIGASAFRPESGVVIQGGSIFASKFASQPVDGGGSPVFRYVVSIPTYPNATVTGMNIAGASFDASGLKTNSNGDLSIFLPDQAGVSGDITLQVGEESVTVPEGQYEVKAPVAVNVEVSGSGQATATPQKMQPSDLVTVHAKPDNGASVASVADYTRVGKTSWSGPYRETVAVSFGQAAAGFNVEGGSAGSDYAFRGDSLFILSGTPLTISNVNPGSEVDQNIEIPADVGANITLNNVNINLSQKPYMPAINIADGSAANVSITVADNSRNTLVPGSWSAAIQKNGTDGVGTLTIGGNGTGLLRALGTQSSIGTFAAAIGGARAGTANIVIEGGKIFTSDAAVGIGAISGFSANNLIVTGGNLITDFSEQPTNGQAPVFKTTVVVEGGADSIVESLQGVDYGTGYDGRLGLFSRDNGDGVLNAYLPSGSQITGGNVDGTEYQAASPIVTTEDGTAEGVLSQAAAFVGVQDVELAQREVMTGESLELVGIVSPEDATVRNIDWSLASDGDTGASLEGNVLHTGTAGTVVVTATIAGGTTDGDFTKNFEINVTSSFVAVEDITLQYSEVEAGQSLELITTVTPEDASNKTIDWSIASDGDTGASLEGNVLHSGTAGTVVVTATIMDGATDGDFTKNFEINVTSSFIPVEDIALASTEVDAGESLELSATVTPESASNQAIDWSIVSDGDTGAWLEGNVLRTGTAGTVSVQATVPGGATDGDFTKIFDITVRDVFVPVEDITLEFTELDAGDSLELLATVAPEDASMKSIEWSIADGGDTGASFEGNVLHTQNAGTVVVTATIMDGAADGHFTKNFDITVRDVFVPVEDITLASTEVDAGDSLELVATVAPEDASMKSIEWSIADGGDTGASFEGNVLHTQNAGTVVVTATIMDGAADGNFTKNFDITVRDVFVPVEDITLASTEVDAGDSLELVATVTPEDASNKSIEWSIADGGDTGASFEGNVLHTQNAGTVVVTATIMDGAADGHFTKNFDITVRDVFVPVEDITLASTEVDAGDSLELVATVAPEDASMKSIEWSIADGGDTGASFEGNVLHTQNAGTVVVTATILDGTTDGNFTKNFEITVRDVFVPVEDITLASTEVDAGDSLELVATVTPEDASNKSIEWSIADGGDTGASFEGNVLHTQSAGTVLVTATVMDGAADGNFTKNFEITVRDVFVPVEDITLESTSVDAGQSLELVATVTPEDASNKSIEWSISDGGDTGASFEGNVLHTQNAGTVVVTATILDGTTDGNFTKNFEITVRDVFVPVEDITLESTSVDAGQSLELVATVTPEDASNKSIEWSIADGGDTGASFEGNVLHTQSAGTVLVTATVMDGATDGNFTKNFEITVRDVFVPVEDITLESTSVDAGQSLELVATVTPEDASNKSIEWSIADGGDTGASFEGNVLHTQSAGTVVVTATILDGVADGNFTKNFNIVVGDVFVPVEDISLAEDTVDAGESLELVGTVSPDTATNDEIQWSLVDAGTTGATLEGNALSTASGGKVLVTGSIIDGLAEGQPYSETFEITVDTPFVPVESITLDKNVVDAGDDLTLTGAVLPEDATNRSIVWDLVDAGTTGATLADGVLSTVSGGTVKVTATVQEGLGSGADFVQEFEIEVRDVFVPVTDISMLVTDMVVGESVTLESTVEPANATDTSVSWSITDDGGTGANLAVDVLTAERAGTIKLTATVADGFAVGEGFTKDFEITVHEAFVAVADIQMDLTEVTVGEAADLAATVLPEDATNKTIVWSVTSGEASISDNKLTAAAPGDLVLEARIADGKVDGDFVKTFNVKAVEGFVPVQDITLAEDTFQAGATLELVATIVPEGATNKDVSFSIADDGGTDATLDGNKVSAPRPGKILITAEIADGMAPGQRYVKDFTLTVEPIPVTDIVLDLTAIESGDTVELEGRVEPENASYKTIVWELVNADTTGAVLDGTTLKTTAGGRVVLKAKVEKGLANGEPFEKYFEIEVNQRVILVSEISLEQDEMLQGETLNLSGTIVPADATNKAIKWSLKDAGTTGATLNEAVLSAPNAGTATVTATVEQGDEEAFVQDFKIMVHAVFVAVEDIIDIPTELEAGDSLLLAGTITPDNATNKNIYWAMTSAGTTRSTLIDGTLTTAAGGTVKLTAKVRNGVAIGEDFVKHFEITVNDAGQTPTTPVFKVNLPPSVNVVVGNLVTFTVEMEESNAEEVRYAWYKDGELIAGANEPTLTIEEAADTDAGQYKVVVTNVLNDQEAAAESTVSELRVTAAPIVNYQIYFGSQQTFRGGNIGLMFGTNIPFEKFNSLSINGVVTPVNQYDARPGSTIIEISANYLNMFKNGTYHMRINAVDGFAEVTFYVQRDTEPSETVEVAPITTATVTPTPTPAPTETSPVTTDPRETTIITYPTTTETTPDITRTGEGSSLIYIIAGIGLLALAGVILILTMRKRRDDEFEDDDQDRPI